MSRVRARNQRRLTGVLLLGLLLSGCLDFQVSNSFSHDAEVFVSDEVSPVIDEESTDLFVAAHDVFERKCTGCHHAFDRYSESELAAWLTPGSSDDSVLYQYLKGSGFSTATMPPNAELAEEDRLAIKSWIDGMAVTQEAEPADATDAREAESPSAE